MFISGKVCLLGSMDINPIPTSHGWNQPIYERHLTTAGRNRAKRQTLLEKKRA